MSHIEGSKRLAIVCGLAFVWLQVIMSVGTAQAATVHYTLDNVILADGEPITGMFDWTFSVGDFEGGSGVFTALEIPWRPDNSAPPLEQAGIVLTIEDKQIEISLDGNFHDYGLDIILKFLQPLSPTQSTSIDLSRSFFECCGNGFKDQPFISGSISPIAVPICEGDFDEDGDGVGDACDNCIDVRNPGQEDANYPEDDNPTLEGMQHYGNACDADYNNNGFVGLEDFNELRTWFGQSVLQAPAYIDCDSDNIIGLSDFNCLRTYFGQIPGPGIGD